MTDEFAPGATISVADDVRFREIDGEAVLLSLRTGKYFGLDEVGTVIWTLLVEHRSASTVLDHLAERYEEPRERLEADLVRFLELLREHGLVGVDQQ